MVHVEKVHLRMFTEAFCSQPTLDIKQISFNWGMKFCFCTSVKWNAQQLNIHAHTYTNTNY